MEQKLKVKNSVIAGILQYVAVLQLELLHFKAFFCCFNCFLKHSLIEALFKDVAGVGGGKALQQLICYVQWLK